MLVFLAMPEPKLTNNVTVTYHDITVPHGQPSNTQATTTSGTSSQDQAISLPWGEYKEADSYSQALERMGGIESLAVNSEVFPKTLSINNYGLIYEGLFKTDPEMVKITNLNINPEDVIEVVLLRIYLHHDDQLQIKLVDPVNERWEIPETYPYPYAIKETDPEIIAKTQNNSPKVDITIDLRPESFCIEVKRKGTDQVVLKLNNDLVYSNLYIHFKLELSSIQLNGFGERTTTVQYQPGTYSLFSIDRGSTIDNGQPGKNKHGHHPMYLNREEPSGNFNLMYFRNSNAQELTISKHNRIKWRAIGGIIDLNVWIGGANPEEVVDQYHRYIGGWAVPALWHLGYHQNKWKGYMSVEAMETVFSKFKENNIPLDVLWSDVEYFIPGFNLVFNEELYNPVVMQALFDKYGKRWIAIADAVVPQNETYGELMGRPDYKDFAIKDSIPGRLCDGFYLQELSYILDFFLPNITDFWYYAFDKVYSKVKFSGLWIDSNEITTDPADKLVPKELHMKYRNLPYTPGKKDLYNSKIINPECMHAGGLEEFNVKSLNTIKQAELTHKYLRENQNHPYPFVLSRATAVGGAKFSYHWIPDMRSKWSYLKDSFGSILSASLFGYNFVGTEICGFLGVQAVDPELCFRWHQMGIFHPFLRNHHMPRNGTDDNSQEPYVFQGEYLEAITRTIRLRYSFMKWMLSVFFEKGFINNEASGFSPKGVGALLKPLNFIFYADKTMPEYGSDVFESQFMAGSGVMVAPAFYKKKYAQSTYFPVGIWTDLRNLDVIVSNGEFRTIDCQIVQDTPFFLYEGKMFFFNEDQTALSSAELNNEYRFVFSLDKEGKSSGSFMNVADYSEENVNEKCLGDNCMVEIKAVLETIDQTSQQLCFSIVDKKGNQVEVNNDLLFTKISVTTGHHNVQDDKLLMVGHNQKDIDDYDLVANVKADGDRIELEGAELVPLHVLQGLCVAISA